MTLEDYNFLLNKMTEVVSLKNETSKLETEEFTLKGRIKEIEVEVRVSEDNLSDSKFISKKYSEIKEPEHPGGPDHRRIESLENEIRTSKREISHLKVRYEQLDTETSELKDSNIRSQVTYLMLTWVISLLLIIVSGLPHHYMGLTFVICLIPLTIIGAKESTRNTILELKSGERSTISREMGSKSGRISDLKNHLKSLSQSHKDRLESYEKQMEDYNKSLESGKKASKSRQSAERDRIESLNNDIKIVEAELDQVKKELIRKNQHIISSLESVAHLTPYSSRL